MMDRVRTVVRWAVFLAVIYAAWNVGPVYLGYFQFKNGVAEATREGGQGPERELAARVAALATSIGVPVEPRAINVSKDRTLTHVHLTYTEELRLLPGVSYPWTFSISAEGLAVKPQTMTDVLGELP